MLEPSGQLSSGRGESLAPFHVWATAGLTVGGTHGGETELLVDGAPTKISQMSGYVPNVDSVQEAVITQNSTDAERGFSGGGVISLATKSGTNEWHGSGVFNGRNPVINGNTFKYGTPSVGRKSIEAFAVGNPIRKNKLFTFNSFERWLWTPDSSGFTSTQPRGFLPEPDQGRRRSRYLRSQHYSTRPRDQHCHPAALCREQDPGFDDQSYLGAHDGVFVETEPGRRRSHGHQQLQRCGIPHRTLLEFHEQDRLEPD